MKGRSRAAIMLFVAILAAGCERDATTESRLVQTYYSEPVRIIASEHLRFLDSLVEEIHARTGVTLDIDYRDDLSINREIQGENSRYTLARPMSGHFLSRLPVTSIREQAEFFSSPIVSGLDAPAERVVNWCTKAPSWRDISKAVAESTIRLAMPRPQPSNTGYLAVLSAVDNGDSASAQPVLQGSNTRHLPDNDRSADAFLSMAPSKALIAPEKALREATRNGADMCIAHPSDDTALANFPLTLVDAKYQPTFAALSDYFSSPLFRERLAGLDLRGVAGGARGPLAPLRYTELDMNRDTVEFHLMQYYTGMAGPGHWMVITDVTPAMSPQTQTALERYLVNLSAEDSDSFHPYYAFREGEQVTLITFADKVEEMTTWVHPAPVAEQNRQRPVRDVSDHRVLYSAIQRGYMVAYQGILIDEDRPHTIVLIAAGEASGGLSKKTFEQAHQLLTERAPPLLDVPTYTVAMDSQGLEPLLELTRQTNGMPFKATLATLPDILKMLRSYQ